MSSEQWDVKAQKAGEERLQAIAEYELQTEELGEPPPIDYPAVAPWCGCDTCVVREVLDAAWPHLLELARAELCAAEQA